MACAGPGGGGRGGGLSPKWRALVGTAGVPGAGPAGRRAGECRHCWGVACWCGGRTRRAGEAWLHVREGEWGEAIGFFGRRGSESVSPTRCSISFFLFCQANERAPPRREGIHALHTHTRIRFFLWTPPLPPDTHTHTRTQASHRTLTPQRARARASHCTKQPAPLTTPQRKKRDKTAARCARGGRRMAPLPSPNWGARPARVKWGCVRAWRGAACGRGNAKKGGGRLRAQARACARAGAARGKGGGGGGGKEKDRAAARARGHPHHHTPHTPHTQPEPAQPWRLPSMRARPLEWGGDNTQRGEGAGGAGPGRRGGRGRGGKGARGHAGPH